MERLILIVVILALCVRANAQGVVSGSLETNNLRYVNDEVTGAGKQDDPFGSNNYLKVDYSNGPIRMGIQYEGYFPSIIGYSRQLKGSKLTNRYLSYTTDVLDATVGHFYVQFGSGLILRTFEERSLGINNALDGVNVTVKPASFITVKGVWGKQRKYMESGDGIVRGADANFSIGNFVSSGSLLFDVGASWVSRFEDYTGPEEGFPETVDAYALRTQVDFNGMSFYSEYVTKGEDPSQATAYRWLEGDALLVNVGYTTRGLGFNASFRRLENMDYRSERDAMGEVAMINYLPALTRQHGYALALLHPYAVEVMGEIGGQVDIFYTIKKKSKIGGKYGTKLHLNYARYYSLNDELWLALGDETYYSDLSFDMSRKWGRKFKSIFSLVNQNYIGKVEDVEEGYLKLYIAIGDFQYKLSSKFSLRGEVQHLWSEHDEKNWAMALLECSYAPALTLFASDMYNYGDTKIHYYNFGGSYSSGSSQFALSFARNREGLQCVGGVCRYVPAFSGLSFSITSQF